MEMVNCRFLVKGNLTINDDDFKNEHFKQLTPAEAGRCIMNMKYQVIDVFCDYGRSIELDPRIQVVSLDPCRQTEFMHLRYIGAYALEFEEELDDSRNTVRCLVYFLLIPSNSDSIFAFYDVKCA